MILPSQQPRSELAAAQPGSHRRLPQILGRRVAPRPVVDLDHVLDLGRPTQPVVVGELRIEATDRIEPVEDIDPAAANPLVCGKPSSRLQPGCS